MNYLNDKSFFFRSYAPSVDKDTFSVVNFTGHEGVSTVYSFEINLISDDPEIDLGEVLSNRATLYLKPNEEMPIHGVLSSFEQLDEVDGKVFYRAVLTPKVWQLSMYQVSEVYLDMTFPEILEAVLLDGGLKKPGFDIQLKRTYKQWPYVAQYQESHLNFIRRWMEREGIYFWFEQRKSHERLIVTDSIFQHVDNPTDPLIHFDPPSGMGGFQQGMTVTNMVCRQSRLPKKVMLQDFNSAKSPPIISGEAEVSANGTGEVYIYGDNVEDNTEAVEYAGIRAEEIKCREKVFYGETTALHIRPGYFFEMDSHYRSSFNRKYLLTSVDHEGSQAAILLAGVNYDLSEKEKKAYYTNSIESLPDDVQYRPLRTTPKSVFHGTINAKVEAEGAGDYAQIDSDGRYKIKLPFDRSDLSGQKASHWIRMASPFTGPSEGMHFPLRKGAEVLLTFMDGDPDRPLIQGSAPAVDTPSVVTDINFTKNVIKTSGNNFMEMNDDAGAKRIHIHTPGNLWVDSNHSYGEYVAFKGVRNDTDAVPSGIKDLRDKMYDYSGDFKPKGVKTFIHEKSSPSNRDKKTYGDPDDFDAISGADKNAKKWQFLVDKGHVHIQKGDKFITHEGNIYDFGGYWNYNLGNCYIENYISQSPTLNTRRDLKTILGEDDGDGEYPDLLNAGGPDWSSFSWPPEDSKPGGTWSNGNVWVEKKYGKSYDYMEGNTAEVQAGDSLDVKYGGKHVEWIYRSDGSKKHYEMRGGRNTSEEKKWMSDGTLTFQNTVDKNYNETEIVTHPGKGVASFEFTTWPPWFNFKAAAAGIPKISISLGASTNNTSISISACTSIGIDISAAAKFSIDLAASLFIKISAGAGIGAEIEGKPSTLTYKSTNGKFRWNGPGTKVEKEAAVKADMEKFALRKMMTMLKKGDMQLINLSLAAQKSLAGIEKADIKLFT